MTAVKPVPVTPVTPATWYAVYAHVAGLLAAGRPEGAIGDNDLARVITLARGLSRAHAALDRHREPVRSKTVATAIARAEDLTDGIIDAVREAADLHEQLSRLLVDAALALSLHDQ
jgi:hypothetical protein